MAAIDKITAATLFAHSFKLVDKEGNKIQVSGIHNEYFVTDPYGIPVGFNQIGTDFWVLKRDFSMLTKSITVEGETIVPLFEICDEGRKGLYWSDGGDKRLVDCHWFKGNKVVEHDAYEAIFNFGYDVEGNMFYSCIHPETDDEHTCNVLNQEKLFQKLYSLHFIDLPKGTYKLIEE